MDKPNHQPDMPIRTEDIQNLSQYLLHSRIEVLHLLRALRDRTSLVTVTFNHGEDFFLTSVLDADDGRLVIEIGADEPTNRKAVAAERLVCVTNHEKVKVQFALSGVRRIEHRGRPAFAAALPESVLRLQRREYFRLATPIAKPLRLDIPIAREDGSVDHISMQLLDISAGGVSVIAPPAGLLLETDARFGPCRLELPEVGVVQADIRVRNGLETTLRSGTRQHRYGCEFIDLPTSMQTLIERYILRVERERKARESGLSR